MMKMYNAERESSYNLRQVKFKLVAGARIRFGSGAAYFVYVLFIFLDDAKNVFLMLIERVESPKKLRTKTISLRNANNV